MKSNQIKKKNETCLRKYGTTRITSEPFTTCDAGDSMCANVSSSSVVYSIKSVFNSYEDICLKMRPLLLNNCFNNKGALKNSIPLNLIDRIQRLTGFLPQETRLPERILSILNLQVEPCKCAYCGTTLLQTRHREYPFCNNSCKKSHNILMCVPSLD
jgi:hypothetical protein